MNKLIIFAKYPEPGKVKTRLAKDLGDIEAARIYSFITQRIIERTLDPDNYNTIIFYDPADKEREIKQWIDIEDIRYLPQLGSTLGDRISDAFEKVYSNGADKAVIIGSDCLDVDKETINHALELLESTDIVLGPAEDGGYYLLGTNKYLPIVFQDIEWSTEHVLSQTIDRIKKNSLKFELIKTLRDIDTVDDLERTNIGFTVNTNTKS